MSTPEQQEYVTATEATRLLDVSKAKMAKLLRTGEIPYISDPRNERAKLIKRSDINAWLTKAPRPRVHPQRRKQPETIQESQVTWRVRKAAESAIHCMGGQPSEQAVNRPPLEEQKNH